MFAFCAKKREKANINENIETLNFNYFMFWTFINSTMN